MSVDELARRRGFFFVSQEAYGGSSGFMVYGPNGTEIKTKLEDAWRSLFVRQENNMEISSPNIMVESVFDSSGHLDTFDDLIVECGSCGSQQRADHLIEDQSTVEDAESFSTKEAKEAIRKHEVVCRDCDQNLSNSTVRDFNLMFNTKIGPGQQTEAYLRPETAQGIFTEFHRLKQYLRSDFPAGIAQIGRAYRNEISPRGGLKRLRELSQAELEKFVLPGQKPDGINDFDRELSLLSRARQKNDSDPVEITVSEALDREIIENEWIGYYIGKAARFYEMIGLDLEKIVFRQHREDELSHYASDCWDAEALIDGDMVEITGFAFRGCHDLKQHHENSEKDFKVFREFESTEKRVNTELVFDMSQLGPKFGSDAQKAVKKAREKLENDQTSEDEVIEVEVEEEILNIRPDEYELVQEEEEVHGERIFPQVVEPSFGLDRIVLALLHHSYRKDTVDGEERTFLSLPGNVSPKKVAIMPLMDKDGMSEKAVEIEKMLKRKGFSTVVEKSGSIGRRYRRMDEIGVPFCITIDYETLEGSANNTGKNTVTVRHRDSTKQNRVKIENLVDKLNSNEVRAKTG